MVDQLWQQEIVARVEDLEEAHTMLRSDFRKAFPGEDFEGHRRYHEELQERNAELRRLRVAIQEKTISGLIWAAVVLLAYSVLHEIKRVLQIP